MSDLFPPSFRCDLCPKLGWSVFTWAYRHVQKKHPGHEPNHHTYSIYSYMRLKECKQGRLPCHKCEVSKSKVKP